MATVGLGEIEVDGALGTLEDVLSIGVVVVDGLGSAEPLLVQPAPATATTTNAAISR